MALQIVGFRSQGVEKREILSMNASRQPINEGVVEDMEKQFQVLLDFARQ